MALYFVFDLVEHFFPLVCIFLIIETENMPTAVHIFDFPTFSQSFSPRLRSVLLHAQPVHQVRWNPVRKGNLVLCCGSPSVYTWSNEWLGEGGEEEEIAECIGVPASERTTCCTGCS